MIFAIKKVFDSKAVTLNLCLLNNSLHFTATVVASFVSIIAAVIATITAIIIERIIKASFFERMVLED